MTANVVDNNFPTQEAGESRIINTHYSIHQKEPQDQLDLAALAYFIAQGLMKGR